MLQNYARRIVLITSLIAVLLFFSAPDAPTSLAAAAANRAQMSEAYGTLAMSFEPNLGQTDASVRFLSRGPGYSLFLTSTEAVLTLSTPDAAKKQKGEKPDPQQTDTSRSAVVRMRLSGANPAPELTGVDELPGKINYLRGNDPKAWQSRIPTYGKVRYSNVYSGIDLVYYGQGRQLEYDFIVAPGADPDRIRLGFGGTESVFIDESGDLILGTNGHEIRMLKPVVYQQAAGKRQEVAGTYVLLDRDEVGFEVGKYDVREPLVIDPVVSYSTYLGGSGQDYGLGIAVDVSGNTYVTGYTSSINFPTLNPLQSTNGGGFSGWDVFVSKLSSSGSLVYSTYLGGTGDDVGYGVSVDASGNAYVTGSTASVNFPTASPLQSTKRGMEDAFVSKLNATGSALLYSTYLGGTFGDGAFGIAVDVSGNAYVIGNTASTDFPTANPFQSTLRSSDAFISKLNAAGSALLYSTYLGGSDIDVGTSIAVDTSANAYVTGYTSSTNFPAVNALQPNIGGGRDAFVTKLNAAGSAVHYSTYLGGSNFDGGFGIAVDVSGFAYVTGSTASTNFPAANALQPTIGNTGGTYDAFVSKLSATGSSLLYSTYLGGSDMDQGNGIAVDASGNAYVSGYTDSINFPTASPLQQNSGGNSDVVVSKLNAAGSSLVYSTYLGGTQYEEGYGIAVDTSGDVYVTGSTSSISFPISHPLQPTLSGGYDAFISKIIASAPLPLPTLTSIIPSSGAQGSIVDIALGGTNFISGSTTVAAGTGVSVGNVSVVSPTLMTARFTIDSFAGTGARNVTVATPAGTSNAVSFAVVGSGICHFTMNKATYTTGDSLIIQTLSLTNPDVNPRTVEYKFWIDVPGSPIYSYMKGGADNSVTLAPGYSNPNVLGSPQVVTAVTASFPPRGVYNISCRLVNPDTAQEIVLDSTPFVVQ